MAKILILTFSLSFITMLAGCATESVQEVKRQVVSNPLVDSIKSTDVGSVIYEEFDDKAIILARLQAPLSFSSYSYEKGEYLRAYRIRGERYFCSSDDSQSRKFPCFLDTNLDGHFDRLLAYNYTTYEHEALKNNSLPYAITVEHLDGVKGYKMQLMYQGMEENSIYVSYREFIDDFEKPVFSQNVKFPLNTAGRSIIGYKGSKIEILRGTDTELEYQVMKGFDG